MRSLTAALLLLAPAWAMAADIPAWLQGVWQSDEQRTLHEISLHPEIPGPALENFQNHFFGRMVQVFRPNDAAYFMVDQVPTQLEFNAAKVTETTEHGVTLAIYDPATGGYQTGVIYRSGECFYVHASEWLFREYFCPAGEAVRKQVQALTPVQPVVPPQPEAEVDEGQTAPQPAVVAPQEGDGQAVPEVLEYRPLQQ